MSDNILDKIVSLTKRRGFVFPSSEIYGGWEATYDYGPLGAEMLRNLRNLWWKRFVHQRTDVVGLDGAIISHPRVWEASGHTELFADVMVEDIVTNRRYRADHLIEDAINQSVDGSTPEEIAELIKKHKILSPDGNPLSSAKYFNQLVEVEVGTIANEKTKAYLRGETCQPIFYNYKLVKDSMRLKLPFGIAQIGKAFRNEIKVGPFFFRTREFEQMELEMFVHPDQNEIDRFFNELKEQSREWVESLGVPGQKLRYRAQTPKERAHYNKVAHDLEYEFDYGWKEFQGIHYRTDWDLKRHGEYSGHDFTYHDEETGESFIPHVVEYSLRLSRLVLVLLYASYREENDRTWLALDPRVAPYQVAVFPLLRNKPELIQKAREVFELISPRYHTAWDDRGNIGKRYFSQDEIGTPWCITIDFNTLNDQTVTIRNRDTTQQERVAVEDLVDYFDEKLTSIPT